MWNLRKINLLGVSKDQQISYNEEKKDNFLQKTGVLKLIITSTITQNSWQDILCSSAKAWVLDLSFIWKRRERVQELKKERPRMSLRGTQETKSRGITERTLSVMRAWWWKNWCVRLNGGRWTAGRYTQGRCLRTSVSTKGPGEDFQTYNFPTTDY